uniref:Uncharacterized protein n=1 Tax=Plectus sambesii TaxID=2011161 RepID=A0A914V3N2_9BILA
MKVTCDSDDSVQGIDGSFTMRSGSRLAAQRPLLGISRRRFSTINGRIIGVLASFVPDIRSCLTLAIGCLIGTTIAFSCFYELSYTVRQSPLFYNYGWRTGQQNSTSESSTRTPSLRCIVLFNGNLEKPTRHLSAIKDTFAPRCNETLFYTTLKELKERYEDELNIFTVDASRSTPDSWNFYKAILEHSVRNRTAMDWTVISDEQTFVIPENARRLVAVNRWDPDESFIVGRRMESFSLLSLLLPWKSTAYYSLNAGVMLSRGSLRRLFGSENSARHCTGLFYPSGAELALSKCFQELGAFPVDGTDSSGAHYFLPEGPKALIPQSGIYGRRDENRGVLAKFIDDENEKPCCSDRAVTFGRSSYKELRMIGYTLYNLRRFGEEDSVE